MSRSRRDREVLDVGQLTDVLSRLRVVRTGEERVGGTMTAETAPTRSTSLPGADGKVPNATTRRAMAELEAGKGKRFEMAEELFEDLRS